MGGAGVGIDFGHGEPLAVFGQVSCAHEAAVQVDVLGMSGVACLDELLRDDALSACRPLGGEPGGAVALACIGVDAAYKVDVILHISWSFRMICLVLLV